MTVDPSSFQRSAGLTGGGTVSWQCAPAAYAGAPQTAEADAVLIAAARTLAGVAQGPPVTEDSLAIRLRGHGTSGALIMPDGALTNDSSLREPLGRHPLVRTMLTEARTGLTTAGRATGRGECVEVSLVSTRMYDLDRKWTAAGRPGELRVFALDAFRGAAIAVRQVGDVNGTRHGERRAPCRVCSLLLAALGIDVATPAPRPAEPAEPTPPVVPVPGDMASRSTAVREWLLGSAFRHEGRGAAGLAAVAGRLVTAGHGASALVLATWAAADNGHYAWTAANRDGVVWWLDDPSHEASRAEPLYASLVDGVWAIVLAPDGRPMGEGPLMPAAAAARAPAAAPGPPFDPARPTTFDSARLAEIRVLVTEYAGADPDGRVAIRVELATLIDDLGVRPGRAESNDRWAALPADVAAHLLVLATPTLTPRAVATVLAADPARLNAPQRAWRDDFERHLGPAFLGAEPADAAAVAAGLAERMHRLAVAGETGPASLPRIPAYAGQVIGLPPDRLAVLRRTDPDMADRAAVTGIYIDLTGRPDLTPYAATGTDPIRLGDPPDDLDLATEDGRATLCAEDRSRARAAFRARHSGDPRVLTALSTHEFHYVGPGAGDRQMALVPDLLTAAVRAIIPVGPTPAERRPSLRRRRRAGPPPSATAPAGEPATESPAGVVAEQHEAQPAADPAAAPRTVRATAAVPVQRPAATAPVQRPPATAPVQRPPATAPVQRPPVDVAYYALADAADRPTGLLVVAMLPGGPQTRRFEAPGARTAGSPIPVSRQRAEQISREALGFELPAEPRLPELLSG